MQVGDVAFTRNRVRVDPHRSAFGIQRGHAAKVAENGTPRGWRRSDHVVKDPEQGSLR